MADFFAEIWLMIADRFERKPWLALLAFLLAAALVAAAVVLVGP